MYTYRAILSRLGVDPSPNANVAVFDDEHVESEMFDMECEDDGMIVVSPTGCDLLESCLPSLSHFVEDVCEYIAGFVVRRLLKRLKCDICRQMLVAFPEERTGPFLELRDKGGLVKPSGDVVSVIHTTEKVFRMMTASEKPGHQLSQLGRKLETEVIGAIDLNRVFLSMHRIDTANGIDDHIILLVRSIVRSFLEIRKFHLLKNFNISVAGANVRHSLTKTILFKNQ
jgi:hypothetical protein